METDSAGNSWKTQASLDIQTELVSRWNIKKEDWKRHEDQWSFPGAEFVKMGHPDAEQCSGKPRGHNTGKEQGEFQPSFLSITLHRMMEN